jgi:hypothetical protein
MNTLLNENRALGVSFYQMCTGELPFYANSEKNLKDLIFNQKEPELPTEFEEYKPLYHK